MATKTQISDIRWQVDIYPYKTFYPQPDESDSSDVFGDMVTVSTGIVGISLSRSKSSVNDICTIDLYGPINKAFFKGNWVIIRSLHGNPDFAINGFPQFFGQIEGLSTSYTVGGNGKIIQSSSITVRSWAFILRTPVKFDQFAMSQLKREDAVGLAKTVSSVSKDVTPEKLADMITKAANPFEFGVIILSLIGGINKVGQDNTGDYLDFISGQLPEVALTAPRIHPGLYNTILPNISGQKGTDFPSFLAYIGGVAPSQGANYLNEGYFMNMDKYEDYKTFFSNPKDRPVNTGFAPVLLHGESAWDLLDQMTDSVCNEMFADFFCINDDDLIYIKPFVTVRDKPFALKRQIKALDGQLNSKWSSYDDVQRTTIDASQILGIQLSDSFLDSPNFIRVQYNNSELTNDYSKVHAALSSTIRKKDEMSRYGGQAIYPFTSFVDLEGKLIDNWYADLAALMHLWHGLKYKMPDMRLSLKDLAIPFTVGTNLEFELNGITYVGHIESFAKSYRIMETGAHMSSTSISLSRVVIVNKDDKMLDFMPPEYILDLFHRGEVSNQQVKPKGNVADIFRSLV